jgi:hypothetical protein
VHALVENGTIFDFVQGELGKLPGGSGFVHNMRRRRREATERIILDRKREKEERERKEEDIRGMRMRKMNK